MSLRMWYVKGLGLDKHLSPEEKQALNRGYSCERPSTGGQFLYLPTDEPGNFVAYIEKGEVSIVKITILKDKREVVAPIVTLRAGDIFGDLEKLYSDGGEYSARSNEPSEVFIFRGRNIFDKFIEQKNLFIGQRFGSFLTGYTVKVSFKDMLYKPTENKLGIFLVYLARKFGKPDKKTGATKIPFPVSEKFLSHYTFDDGDKIGEILSDLKERNLIIKEGTELLVKDIKGIKEL